MSTAFVDLQESKPRTWSPRKLASGLGLWVGLTLLGSAVVHVLVVFALPSIGRDIVVEDIIPHGEAAPILYTGQGGQPLPAFRYDDARSDSVYCSFDLRDGAVRVAGRLDVPYWSISVHTLSGLVVGSVNHNAAIGGELEVLILRPALARDLIEAGAQLPSESLAIQTEGPLGIVRITGLADFEAQRPALQRALGDMTCELASFTFAEPEVEETTAPSGPAQDLGPPTVPQPQVRPSSLDGEGAADAEGNETE